jgi:hypothetical protein
MESLNFVSRELEPSDLYSVTFATVVVYVTAILLRNYAYSLSAANHTTSLQPKVQSKRDGKKRRARAKKQAAAAAAENVGQPAPLAANTAVIDDVVSNKDDNEPLIQRVPVFLANDPRLKAGKAGPVHIGQSDNTSLDKKQALSSQRVSVLFSRWWLYL